MTSSSAISGWFFLIEAVANKSLHVQIERKAKRTWQARTIMPICSSVEFKFLTQKILNIFDKYD